LLFPPLELIEQLHPVGLAVIVLLIGRRASTGSTVCTIDGAVAQQRDYAGLL
jgi:hypothetical protein